MFTTDLVNLYDRNIFKTSLYIYIFQDEKCRLMRNLSLSMGKASNIAWQSVTAYFLNKSNLAIRFVGTTFAYYSHLIVMILVKCWQLVGTMLAPCWQHFGTTWTQSWHDAGKKFALCCLYDDLLMKGSTRNV